MNNVIHDKALNFETRFVNAAVSRGFHVTESTFLNRRKEHVHFLSISKTSSHSTAVFVHGTGNDLFFPYVDLYNSLLANGYNVFAFDICGHGRQSSSTLDPQGLEECLVDAMEQAKNHISGDLPFFLVGHSLGGAIVLNTMAKNNLQVAKAVVIGVPLRISVNFKTAMPELLSFIHPNFLMATKIYGIDVIPAFGRFRRDTYPIRTQEHQTRALSYVKYVNAAIRKWDLINAAKKVACPTLYVYGSYDMISPVSVGRDLCQNTSLGDLYVVPFANHLVTVLSSKAHEAIAQWLLGGKK
ncbi:MAG: alpha/beta hydrolase [Oligoflexales bacterium]